MAIDIKIKGKVKTYRVTSDPRQFILSEQKIMGLESKSPGEKYFVEIAYFTRLSCLIEKITMFELNDMDITTMTELRDAVTEMGQRFSEIFDWQESAA
jgi:hypothetical protein